MRARCAVATSTGESLPLRYCCPSSAMPRSQRSAAAMAISQRGGVERRRRLEGPDLARVHLADGLERVPQEALDQRQPLFGNCDPGNADALAHLVQRDTRILGGHGIASIAKNGGDSTGAAADLHREVCARQRPAIASSCRSGSAAAPRPIMRISGCSVIPYRSPTRARVIDISASTSSGPAVARFTMRLLHLTETSAPLMRLPRIPTESMRRSAECPGGFFQM